MTSTCTTEKLRVEPTIIVHGGAWAIPDSLAERSRAGVLAAVRAGLRVLKARGSAVDAVEAAVVTLEDDPAFDAGTGSTLTSEGKVEMDSVIMDGRDLRLGAVACIQNVRNPVKVARLVMDKTDHTMLVGSGANQFAAEMGVPEVPMEDLITEEARADLEKYLTFRKSVEVSFKLRSEFGHDTVGAAAVDCEGHVAFATSTGGIVAKRPGRVGDSPIVGCGGYADDSTGALSSTGHGESITKVCLTHHIANLVKSGQSPQIAAEEGLRYMSNRVKGSGGVIVVSNTGEIGKAFTTERMAWAHASGDTLYHGLNPGENFKESVE